MKEMITWFYAEGGELLIVLFFFWFVMPYTIYKLLPSR